MKVVVIKSIFKEIQKNILNIFYLETSTEPSPLCVIIC